MKPSINTAIERTVISTRDNATRVARLKSKIEEDIETVNKEVTNDAPFHRHISITSCPTPEQPNQPLVIEHNEPDYFKKITEYCGEIGLACDRLVNYVRCNLPSSDSNGGDLE